MSERDLRDPQKLGEALTTAREFADDHAKRNRLAKPPLSVVADAYPSMLDVPPFDDDTPGPLERYGNPRELHKRRVADGTEPTL